MKLVVLLSYISSLFAAPAIIKSRKSQTLRSPSRRTCPQKFIQPLSIASVTLPDGNRVTAVVKEDLCSYTDDKNFFYRGQNLVLNARPGNYHTKNSESSRTELRAMVGTIMDADMSVTKIPDGESGFVIGQLHRRSDPYVIIRALRTGVIRVEDHSGGFKIVGEFTNNYKLGTFFNIKMVAESGKISVSFNGKLVATMQTNSYGYYKIGSYLQRDNEGDEAEVEISSLYWK